MAVVRYGGTGKAPDLPVVHVFDLRDGKVARFREFLETVRFLEVARAGAATVT